MAGNIAVAFLSLLGRILHDLRLSMAGYADWIDGEPVTFVILYKEEGKGGHCGADPRSGFHICGTVSAGHGISYASYLLLDHIHSGCFWSCLELHELLWLP